MLTVHLFVTEINVDQAVKQKLMELEERKKTDGTCNYIVNESPDGNEFIVDFILGESKNDKMNVVEFNVYRYKQIDLGNSRKGIMIFSFTKRCYGKNIKSFFKSLSKDRIDFINQMISYEMPKIKLVEQ
ncbi:MAG TPA: hypothetical protein VD908_15490 [Cytophagales bacterium]|nr:hypothetical protein [Cytophagales bacterium]